MFVISWEELAMEEMVVSVNLVDKLSVLVERPILSVGKLVETITFSVDPLDETKSVEPL